MLHRLALLLVCVVSPALAGTHPRLVFSPTFVETVRQAELQQPRLGRLRARLSGDLGELVLPGEVLAAAALHLFAPTGGAGPAQLDLIARHLSEPDALGPDLLECVLAMDWCWADLSVTARQLFLRRMLEDPQILEPGDSPLEHDGFRRKLAYLALALAVEEDEYRSPEWGPARTRILRAARDYVLTALPNYLAWRGGVPTSSANGPWEESNTAWLLELGSLAVGKNLWAEHAEATGRWLEHYLLVSSADQAAPRHVVRDDGDADPPHPADHATSLLPMTAHLWAARTGDPAAVALARDLDAALTRRNIDPALWSWLDVALRMEGFATANRERLPAQRNLGGAVVFRNAGDHGQYLIWIEAGQALLRRGQHFDAGHFLIEGDGPLLTDAGADIALEAVGAKRGEQRLGSGRATFPFEQFAASSLAHNCLLFEEASRVYEWHGKPFVPRGGQRPIDGSCRDFQTPLEVQERSTGRLLAYGYRQGASYAALDLTDAYDNRTVTRYTRAFLLLWNKVLLVIDVAEPAGGSVTPIWLAQLPVAPDRRLLDPRLQVRGETEDAGIWRIPAGDWIRCTSRAGTLALRSLLPQERVVSLVGGTGARARILDGAFAGRSYVGGSADTFERLVAPSSRDNVGNAWFRLGAPTRLGAEFGGRVQQLWGRVEIEAPAANRRHLLVTAIVLDPAELPLSQVRITEEPGGALLFLRDGARAATVQLQMRDTLRGFVVVDPAEPAWELPEGIVADPKLETE